MQDRMAGRWEHTSGCAFLRNFLIGCGNMSSGRTLLGRVNYSSFQRAQNVSSFENLDFDDYVNDVIQNTSGTFCDLITNDRHWSLGTWSRMFKAVAEQQRGGVVSEKHVAVTQAGILLQRTLKHCAVVSRTHCTTRSKCTENSGVPFCSKNWRSSDKCIRVS